MKIPAIVEDRGLIEATLKAMGLLEYLARGPPIDLTAEFLPGVEREARWENETGPD